MFSLKSIDIFKYQFKGNSMNYNCSLLNRNSCYEKLGILKISIDIPVLQSVKFHWPFREVKRLWTNHFAGPNVNVIIFFSTTSQTYPIKAVFSLNLIYSQRFITFFASDLLLHDKLHQFFHLCQLSTDYNHNSSPNLQIPTHYKRLALEFYLHIPQHSKLVSDCINFIVKSEGYKF